MIDGRTRRFLDTNLKGLFQDTLEWMDARNAELRENSRFASATPAEAKLFAYLRGKERSISELSRSLGVSRQAAHHTAHRLAKAGLVEMITSPKDGREKRLRITSRGHAVQVVAARNIRQIERELARNIGRDNLELLRDLLVKHLESVRPPGDE